MERGEETVKFLALFDHSSENAGQGIEPRVRRAAPQAGARSNRPRMRGASWTAPVLWRFGEGSRVDPRYTDTREERVGLSSVVLLTEEEERSPFPPSFAVVRQIRPKKFRVCHRARCFLERVHWGVKLN
jgi:hypothetical protein